MKDLLGKQKLEMVYKTQVWIITIMLVSVNIALQLSLWDPLRRFEASLVINTIFIALLLITILIKRLVRSLKVLNFYFLISALSIAASVLVVTFDKSILGLIIFSGPVLLMIFNNFNQRYNILGIVSYLVIIVIFAVRVPQVTVDLGLGFYLITIGSILSMGLAMKSSHDLFWRYDEALKEKVYLAEEKNTALLKSLSELEQSEETIKSQFMEIASLNTANQQVIDQLKAIFDTSDDGIIDIDLERQTVTTTARAVKILGQNFTHSRQLYQTLVNRFNDKDAIAFTHLWDNLQYNSPEKHTLQTKELAYQHDSPLKYLKINGLTYVTSQSDFSSVTQGRHMVLIVKDVTEAYLKTLHIYEMAYKDSLTGLYNRRAFIEKAQEAILIQGANRIAVLVFDIDNFKYINDSFGFNLGDTLLQQIAEGLKLCLSENNECPTDLLAVARFDGDAFGLLWIEEACNDKACQTEANARPYAFYQWIKENLSHQHLDQTQLHLTFSAGVAVHEDPNFALTAAEVAMYKAKERGRASLATFDIGYLDEVKRHHQLTTALEEALVIATKLPFDRRGQQLALHYQPIYSAVDQSICSFEALARWYHPTYGAIAPDEFIAVAEKSGQILALGEWVTKEAIRFSLESGQRVCVNVSPVQLLYGEDYANQLIKLIDASNLPRDRIGIEITESVLLQDRHKALQQLYTLRDAGISVALDDFGSGYSSLSYLVDLPISTLKIDKAFIRSLTDISQKEAAIIGTIIHLATQLGMATVAEGVERQEQLEILKTLGCTRIQGYLFSPPVPETKLLQLLQ